ncbi:unnamed protein product [Spodoptera littoralis]|uniref:DUF7869 domain-containing protein n=1 Tax=Spodoptera littoralis TaxID=7109 RepID=A0A9P0NAW5_SPOLI|nr:unnamed protein product [Spodoptera littoralis]CAH1646166.1 unnamed protein product [Spodoptera littoralis]
MEYNKVLKSAVIGYESSDSDSSDIPNSPDTSLNIKHITVPESPQSPSLCSRYEDFYAQVEIQSDIFSTNESCPVQALNTTDSRYIETPAKSFLTSEQFLQNDPRSIEAPAYSPLTPGPGQLLQNDPRSIEAPAYSPLTPGPGQLLQNDPRSIEAPAYSPLTPGPGQLLQNDPRSIEAPAHSPLTPGPGQLLQNDPRSIEAPAYSPLTPGPGQLLQNDPRSIEAPAYSPLTPGPGQLLQNDPRSIEAPAYSPLTPKELKLKNNSSACSSSKVGVSNFTAYLSPFNSETSASPIPSMSPQTKKLFQTLVGDGFNSDDSVKDPNYEGDEDEIDSSDYLEEQTSPRTINVEVEYIHQASRAIVKKKSKKEGHLMPKNKQDDFDKIEEDICAENEERADVEKRADNENDCEQDLGVMENEEIDIRKGRPKKGRKRIGIFPRCEIKKRKYDNKPYTDRKHNLIQPKEFRNMQCSCKKMCSNLVSTEERRKEFNTYMHLGSYTAQMLYITKCVEEINKKRTYQPDPNKTSKPKEFTRVYNLGGKIVCREMFLKTLQITTQKVDTALKKMRIGSLTDQRGVTGGKNNRLSSEEYKLAEEVINKLPKYKSHYRRENTDADYLQPGMTVRKMYEDYYLKEFDDLPDKNTRRCLKCDNYAIQQKNGVDVQEEHHAHLKKAESLRKQMKVDFERAQKEPNVECLTFDLEKTLPLPRIPTNIVFYKRQLWVYNSGIHRASDDKGFCYVWVEGEAGRGAQEVASCLLRFIQNELRENTEHLILWSDSCGGQNRNIKITLMLKTALHSHTTLKTISMRFLEPGHTFLPNDTDFSKIETKIKEYDRIYTVEDYMNIMKHAKIRNPLHIKRMNNEQFLGCSNIEQGIVNRKVFRNKKKVNWLMTKEILLKKDFRYSIFMRIDFESEFDELFIKKRLGRGGGEEVEIVMSELVQLWPDGKEIAQAKLNDLRSMEHLIPADCRAFYENLRGNDQILDDLDGYGTIPDFELEET